LSVHLLTLVQLVNNTHRRLPQNKMIMKQVVLNIPDDKYPFFMELVKNLGFVKVPEEIKLDKKQKEFVEGTKNSIEQVEQHLKGEIKLKTADQLYNEL
jgi:hypothetical protein